VTNYRRTVSGLFEFLTDADDGKEAKEIARRVFEESTLKDELTFSPLGEEPDSSVRIKYADTGGSDE